MPFTPYVYLIGWSKHNLWYYGASYANSKNKTAHPSQLWKSYFTSSNNVKKYREMYGEPNIIEIRKTFDSAQKCIEWETKVLKKLNVLHESKWINGNIAGAIFMTDDMKKRIGEKHKGEKHWSFGKPRPEETKQKIRDKRKLQIFSKEVYEKNSKHMSTLIWINNGTKNKRVTPEIQKQQYSNWNIGRINFHITEEYKMKLSNGARKQWVRQKQLHQVGG
jgi:hypothetical protein